MFVCLDVVNASESPIAVEVRPVAFAVPRLTTVFTECQMVRAAFLFALAQFGDIIYKLDWKMHKPMCKALSEIERNRNTFVSLPSEPTKDLTFLNNRTQERISNMAAFCARHMQRCSILFSLHCLVDALITLRRKLTLFERNLISSEPRCMVWYVFCVLSLPHR
jgi:hypothetical protein